MPRYAPVITRTDFLAKLAAYLGAKPEFVEDYDPDLSTERGILKAARKGLCLAGDCGVFGTVYKDWSKIDFDLENLEVDMELPVNEGTGLNGIVELPSGLTFLAGVAGGDWEHPVLFIVYHDGKKFRGYIPTDGNTFNRLSKAAYGNDEVSDLDALIATYPDHPTVKGRSRDEVGTAIYETGMPHLTVDRAAIIADVEKRIQLRS